MGPSDSSPEVREVKELRVQIDACIKAVEALPAFGSSRALATVKTKLEEAKMWGGKRLEEVGSRLPEKYRDEA